MEAKQQRVIGSHLFKAVILTPGNVTAAPAAAGKCTSLALITGLEKREPTRLGIATQL